MDEIVLRAMAKWPNVPAVYGWLSLDRRGEWRLRGERITHGAAKRFISRNYTHDPRGRWYFQNGPQRVFVSLAYTPWVYALDGSGGLLTHTGVAVQHLKAVWLDERGDLIVLSEYGVGVLNDQDLLEASEYLRGPTGTVLDDDTLEAAIANLCQRSQERIQPELTLCWQYRHALLPLRALKSTECPARFSYVHKPVASHDNNT